jgi:hypothetical protein
MPNLLFGKKSTVHQGVRNSSNEMINLYSPSSFLYKFYPANINYTRCCHQPICSECFVHIRQPAEPSMATANCPFCVEPNFGIVYHPPTWAPVSSFVQIEIIRMHNFLKLTQMNSKMPMSIRIKE